LPAQPDGIAPDGSQVRLLGRLAAGSAAHFQLPAGACSGAVRHCSVEEIWYVLGGEGEMWRSQAGREEVVALRAGVSLTIPLGTAFQFRSLGPEPLCAVALTTPPWPGDAEAQAVEGPWQASDGAHADTEAQATDPLRIRPFSPADEAAVIALWVACGLTRPWNHPGRDIERKLAVQPELFLVGEEAGRVVASVMAGYDGHRGWMNYLSVHPDCQGRGFGAQLVRRVEALLLAMGCPKLNLQIREDNTRAIGFYEALGYQPDKVVSWGKRLIPDL